MLLGLTGPTMPNAAAGARGHGAAAATPRTLFSGAIAPTQHYPEGALIADDGAPVPFCYWVVDGWIALSKSLSEGHVQTIDIGLADDLIMPAAPDGRCAAYTVHALTPATLAAMSLTRWERMCTESAALRRLADIQACVTAARRGARMLRLGRGSAVMRIAHALLELHIRVDPAGHSAPNAFHVPMNQRQLGDFVGLCSVHVSRVLGQLARDGVISTTDHIDITLHDIAALCELAEVDLGELRRTIIVPP